VLELVSCRNVRNRDLYMLGRAGMQLTQLVLGDDSNKPWVTNRGLASIGTMTTIRTLSLHDCNSITNNGMSALLPLAPHLEALSLRGCRKITNSGLQAVAVRRSVPWRAVPCRAVPCRAVPCRAVACQTACACHPSPLAPRSAAPLHTLCAAPVCARVLPPTDHAHGPDEPQPVRLPPPERQGRAGAQGARSPARPVAGPHARQGRGPGHPRGA
jgi:hypothetical protein